MSETKPPATTSRVSTASVAGRRPRKAKTRNVSPREQREIAARTDRGETRQAVADSLGLCHETISNQLKRPEVRGLMAQLAEGHQERLSALYVAALESAAKDLTSADWQARDRAREWASRIIYSADRVRGLLPPREGRAAEVQGQAPQAGQYTLTELLTVMRQTVAGGA